MDYAAYAALYPEGPGEGEFERFDWLARRIMDRATTGVDGVRKLTVAPPTEPCAAQAVLHCEAALVRLLWWAERQEGCIDRPDGTVAPRMVTAITAGSESVSFAQHQTAASDPAAREALYGDTVRGYLSGVADANGVSLLYMGKYPAATEGRM